MDDPKDTEERQNEKPEPEIRYSDKFWYLGKAVNMGEYPDHEY